MDESLSLPKIRKIHESMKKISSNTQEPPKSNLVIAKDKVTTVSKPVKVAEIKVESNMNSSAEYDMGYDITEDNKKTKANISLFETCNLPQQRKKLLESFDPQISKSQDDFQSEEEISEASIGGNLNPKHYHFYFLLRFLIIMYIIVW